MENMDSTECQAGSGSERDDKQTTERTNKNNCVVTFKVSVDVIMCAVFAFAFGLRIVHITYPRAVVFDEVILLNQIQGYINNMFFFDLKPPFGKLLLAIPAVLAEWPGYLNLTRVGEPIAPGNPIMLIRGWAVFICSLAVPLVYQILREMNVRQITAVLGAFLVAIESSLITESRFAFPNGFAITFCMATLLCYLKSAKCAQGSLSGALWSLGCGVMAGCAVSIQYNCIFTLFLVWLLCSRRWWEAVGKPAVVGGTQLSVEAVVKFTTLVCVPLCSNLLFWWIHFSLLTKIGNQTYGMPTPFVAALEGGTNAILKSQPREIIYGSAITLRSSLQKSTCWLHSHPIVYPIKYEDGRGSSHQQQVTCYPFKDANNWWFVRKPGSENLYAEFPSTPLKHNDIVEIIHSTSGRKLNSHDVGAPVTPTLMEVSGYIDYNISMAPQTLWRVEVFNRDNAVGHVGSQGGTWKAVTSEVRLVHVNTTRAMGITGKVLPEWAGHQFEVATTEFMEQQSAYWIVEEHKYFTDPAKGDLASQLLHSGFLQSNDYKLGFTDKLYYVLHKQFIATASYLAVETEHRFSSGPLSWLFGRTNAVYWIHPTSNAQVSFVPNIFIWSSAFLSIVIVSGMILLEALLRQRNVGRLPDFVWGKLCSLAEITIMGYAMHYFSFFMTDFQSFVFSYIPALAYSILTLCIFADFLFDIIPKDKYSVLLGAIAAWALICAAFSQKLSPLIYGEQELDATERNQLKQTFSWDFVEHSL